MKIKNFYGYYSSGRSFNKMEKKKFSKKNIFYITKIIKKNLKKMSITGNDLKNKTIMNVGSGLEILGLLKFKPKKIFHYDISEKNVKIFKKTIKRLNLQNKIVSWKFDISKNKLPKNKFDLIYLHGVIQHVDFVEKGVQNLCSSLKKDGYMWFYFYRPGSLNIFLGSLQRFIIKKININYFIKMLKDKYSKNFVDGIIDDTFVPNRQLFYPMDYSNVLKKNNCKIIGNTFLKSMSKKVDFCNFHQSVVFFVKKKQSKKLKKFNEDRYLKRGFDVNVLDKKLYKDKNIVDIIKYVEKINLNDKKKIIQLIVEFEKIKDLITEKYFINKKLNKKEYFNYIYRIKNLVK